MSDVLARICDYKRDHITKCKADTPEALLRDMLSNATNPRGFKRALEAKAAQGGFGLIAEIKKASPSKGIIREHFEPTELARAYEAGGATCLSVLTDRPSFQGCDDFLVEARGVVDLPVLRKDFMLDTYQVTEARALGADCILLIMAALDTSQAQELEAAAFALEMDVLVEVHNAQELELALSHLKSTLIGINNRNLKTLEVDLATSEQLVKLMPAGILTVCESGINDFSDLLRMKKAGISSFLVGESLMRQADVTLATKRLLGIEK